MQELQAATQRELQTAAACDGLCHRFDQAPDGTRVQKTTRRQIVTLELARFEAVEVLRTAPHEVGHLRSPLLKEPGLRSQTPRVLRNFAEILRTYLDDPQVVAASSQYEAAYQLFERLRAVLRLSAQGDHPLHERYVLEETETQDVRQALETLQAECREQSRAAADKTLRDRYQVVVDHLERYEGHLFAAEDADCQERTTNQLEGFWGASKRRCRQRHERCQWTRDFQSLPAD